MIAEPDLADELVTVAGLDLRDDTSLEDHEVRGGQVAADAAERISLRGCRVSNVAFTGARLNLVTATDVTFDDCEFSGAILEASAFTRVRFHQCRMSGFTAAGLDAQHVAFVDCKLTASWFRKSRLQNCSFDGCDLAGSDFYAAQIRDSRLVRSRLDGCEFSQAELAGVALHGSTLDGIKGAGALKNIIIGTDQVVPLALAMFAAVGITVDDEFLDAEPDPS